MSISNETKVETERAIRSLTQELFAALSRRDPDSLYSHFSDDTVFALNGRVVESWTAHRQAGRQWLLSLQEASFTPGETTVLVLSPTSAVAVAPFHCRATDADGVTIEESSVQTWVFAERNGEWQVVHSHVSGEYQGPHR